MAVPNPSEVSSPIQSKGLLPMYWSMVSCGSVPPLSPRPIRPSSVWAMYTVRRGGAVVVVERVGEPIVVGERDLVDFDLGNLHDGMPFPLRIGRSWSGEFEHDLQGLVRLGIVEGHGKGLLDLGKRQDVADDRSDVDAALDDPVERRPVVAIGIGANGEN